MLNRAFVWLETAANLGRMWWLSRRPHIEENLPTDLGPGPWVPIATARPIQPGEPVYGTPAFKAVGQGERFWIFVGEGEYWVYAVPGSEPQSALREFYAEPEHATLIDSGVVSGPGFRTPVGSP